MDDYITYLFLTRIDLAKQIFFPNQNMNDYSHIRTLKDENLYCDTLNSFLECFYYYGKKGT